MHAQVLEKVAKVGKRKDFLVLNFGLHFSETYREELEKLVNEASSLTMPTPHTFWPAALQCDRPCCWLVRSDNSSLKLICSS